MANYQIGDRLYFHTADNRYGIIAGDTAEIVGDSCSGYCVCFDRDVRGHDCDMPNVIPAGYGWWLLPTDLDKWAYVVNDPAAYSPPDLEDVL